MFCWCYIDILLVFWGVPLFQGVPYYSVVPWRSAVLLVFSDPLLCSDVPGFIVHYFLDYFTTCKQYLLATLNSMRHPPIDLHDRYILAKMLISAYKQSLKKKLCSIRMEWKWKKKILLIPYSNLIHTILEISPYIKSINPNCTVEGDDKI